MTTAIEIKSGVELDLAVAESLGLKTAVVCRAGRVLPEKCLIAHSENAELYGTEDPCVGTVACVPFQPSTDLNAAFTAAEKVGLFDRIGSAAMLYQVHRKETTWCVHWRHPGERSAFGATPALAICGAILELKGEST